MITKMTRYTFLLLTQDTEAFLREIQDLGVLDITRSRKSVDAVSAQMFREAETLRREILTIQKCDFDKDERHAALDAELYAALDAEEEKKHWGDWDATKVRALTDAGYRFHYYKVPVKKYNPAWEEQYAIDVIENDGTLEELEGQCREVFEKYFGAVGEWG